MKHSSSWIGALALFFLPLIPAFAQSYGTELNLGTEAYRNARYEEAIQHFLRATELDPTQPVAHLYLATAYTGQYIPGVNSQDNNLLAERAIEQYQRVLDSDAPLNSKMSSAKGIAYLYLNMKKFKDSKYYYQRASGLDAHDPEPYYSIGVVDWTLCYEPRMEARARLGMNPADNLNPKNSAQKKVCDDLGARNTSLIDEGMESLNKALELRPDYDDAMAYMNLMYREKADLECDDPAARQQDLKTADEWVDKTLAVKRAKAEKADRQNPPTAPNPQ